ncbi:MAG: molybdopterin oxidoreductase, partial [Acidimicrobiia bacterium]|nr:molybdopterin oxidoreductase [Acidimicrobiia bacterium]
CSVGCGMLLGVRDGKAVAVKGDPDHPVNQGRLCPKGLSEHHTLAAPGRLTHPQLRNKHGKLQNASWDDALGTMVSRFQRLLAEHGPGSVAVISTGQLVTEEFYTLGKLVRLGMGLAHFDGNTTLCMSSAVSGYKQAFGSDGPPGSYSDFDEADCIVLIGANVADNHPLLTPRVLENRSATTIVVDPRVTKTAMVADQHLAVRPRSDITLLNGIIKLIIDWDLVDHQFVADHTEGYDELVAHVQAFDIDRVAQECGVPAEAVVRAARTIAEAERCTVAWTMGVNHSVQGTETVALVCALSAITGNLGRAGSSPFSITGQCNAMGTREAGFTASMPGYRAYDNPEHRAELAEIWNVDLERVPQARGRAYPDIINGIIDGRIKGLWIIATNPVVSFPNRDLLELALAKLDTFVVQDGFSTPTTELAHIVLPAGIWGEKDGTFTNSERRVSRVRAACLPPGEARTDFDIFLDVAQRWGVRDELFPGWTSPADAFDEWRTVSAGRLCDYSGITYDRIDASGGVQWPCPADDSVPLGGTARLYTDGVVPTPSGRVRLPCVTPKAISERPNRRFPFTLNTGRTVEHWHTRTKTGAVEILDHLAPQGWIEVHPEDAHQLGVRSGDRVRVSSERGSIDAIAVRVTSIVRRGEVFVPFHFDEVCANRLTLNEFDPVSREPNYKQCAVRIDTGTVGR